jgi:hypothetical protein
VIVVARLQLFNRGAKIIAKGVLNMKIILWWIALVVAVVGILIFKNIINIPSLTISSFWIIVGAAGLFAITGLIKKS